MDRPTERLKPIGFWSYARQDDRASHTLTKLRLLLKLELEQQYGAELELFQDVGAIAHGAEWEREIRRAISKSTFFIPIVTPRFLRSEWCGKEMRLFVERQNELHIQYPELAGESLIFPILYVDVKDVEPYDPEAFVEITKRLYLDFRKLRLTNYDSEPVARALEKLASDICVLLRRRLRLAPTFEETALAQLQDEEERRQREDAAASERAKVGAVRGREEQAAKDLEEQAAKQREHAENEKARVEAAESTVVESKSRAVIGWLEAILQPRSRRKEQLRALVDQIRKFLRRRWLTVGSLMVLSALIFLTSPFAGSWHSQSNTKAKTEGVIAAHANNVLKAARLLPGECRSGYVLACTELGYLYVDGRGVAQDYAAARDMFDKGCNGGDEVGCAELGVLYEKGRGVAQDYAAARAYYEKGCKGGDGQSCMNLGVLYQDGSGVGRDYAAARDNYEKACNRGSATGCTNLGFLYSEALGVTQDYVAARAYYEKGCKGGNALGCTNIGELYRDGRGVAQDYGAARDMFDKGCNGGDEVGCQYARSLAAVRTIN